MFPNSPNVKLTLLRVSSSLDNIGMKNLIIISSKEVIGIKNSITSKEFYQSKEKNINVDLSVKILSFLYDESLFALISDGVYKIERTYLNGQFIELYMNKTSKKKEDFIWPT